MLSRRNLHFTTHQMHWHCKQSASPEILVDRGTNTLPHSSQWAAYGPDFNLDCISPGESKLPNRLRSWWRIVEDHSRRALTDPNDKLMALQGIVAKFTLYVQGEMLSGIWSKDLPTRLLWTMAGKPDRFQAPDNPSWSWPSTNREIRHPRHCTEPSCVPSKICATLIHGSQTTLRLRGALYHSSVLIWNRLDLPDEPFTASGHFDFHTNGDPPDPTEYGFPMYLFPVLGGLHCIKGLLVTLYNPSCSRFRRRGVFTTEACGQHTRSNHMERKYTEFINDTHAKIIKLV